MKRKTTTPTLVDTPYEVAPITYLHEATEIFADLRRHGVPQVPCVGYVKMTATRPPNALHIHPGDIEFIYCQRGFGLSFSNQGGCVARQWA